MISCRSCNRGPSGSAVEMDGKKDRFSRPESFRNTLATGFLLLWRNRVRNAAKKYATVTTSHLFPPNQRRKASLLLRFWLPNFDFQPRNRPPGGGGGWQRGPRARPRSKTALGILCVMQAVPNLHEHRSN